MALFVTQSESNGDRPETALELSSEENVVGGEKKVSVSRLISIKLHRRGWNTVTGGLFAVVSFFFSYLIKCWLVNTKR